jgi:SAM-dependent methyltransferase
MRSILDEDRHPQFEQFLRERGVFAHPDLSGHVPRYMHALRHMPFGKYLRSGDYSTALELGTTYIFPQLLLDTMGFERVDVTDFKQGTPGHGTSIRLPQDPKSREVTAYNVDLEKQRLPCDEEIYDLVICFEVIEHMEVDPMFMIAEANRVLKPGGLLYLSTPNSTSARNVFKILNGYAPHFFMKYSKGATYHRHNIEYAPHQLVDLVSSGGFGIRKLWTVDTFEDGLPETIDFLAKSGFSTQHRGDNIFMIAEKVGPVLNRYPPTIYF